MKTEVVDVGSPEFEKRVLEIMARNGVPSVNLRFQRLKDGWIRDLEQGIDFGPSTPNRMNFKDAQAYCKTVGGRLPTPRELQGIVDYSKHEPAVDTVFFADTKFDDWYWTGTICAWNASAAWCVSFGCGSVGIGRVGNDSYVRPVRASQC